MQSGREIEEARVDCEQEVRAVAVSREGRSVINAGTYLYRDPTCGELKAREADSETRTMMHSPSW